MDTAVTETLERLNVRYTVKVHQRPALTAEQAAVERQVRLSQIVKCMVARADSDHLVAMLIPGDCRLKMNQARKHIGSKAFELVRPDALQAELGLIVGAISPTQLLGQARMLFDPKVLNEEFVDISSGDPMAGVELRSIDLLTILGAELIPISQDSNADI